MSDFVTLYREAEFIFPAGLCEMMMMGEEGEEDPCVSVQPPERRAGRRRAAAASSPLTDTDLLFVSRPRHGRRSPTRFTRIPVAPVQAAVLSKHEHRGDKGNEEADDDDDDGGAVRAADRLKLSRSDAAERSPLFGL